MCSGCGESTPARAGSSSRCRPAEVAVHPAAHDDVHELYLLTQDVAALVAELRRRGASCTDPEDHGWGVLTRVTLPGGGHIGVYEPRHERP